jgi:hypothetical protein
VFIGCGEGKGAVMVVTLLDVARRVARQVGLDSGFTAFSELDETADVVSDINDALEALWMTLPKDVPYFLQQGSLNLVNGTRTYALASDARSFALMDWGFENETAEDAPLQSVTLAWVQYLDNRFDEVMGRPTMVYRDGADRVGFYPIPDGPYTVLYRYAGVPARLSLAGELFGIPDAWVQWVALKAQEAYERRKGLGNPEVTYARAEERLAQIMVQAWQMSGGRGLV